MVLERIRIRRILGFLVSITPALGRRANRKVILVDPVICEWIMHAPVKLNCADTGRSTKPASSLSKLGVKKGLEVGELLAGCLRIMRWSETVLRRRLFPFFPFSSSSSSLSLPSAAFDVCAGDAEDVLLETSSPSTVGMMCVPSCHVPCIAWEASGIRQDEQGRDDACQDDAGV